jgi:hypothetical protein
MTLTAAELAYMQATQNTFLPDLCTIRRKVNADDGYGGTTQTNDDRANIACRAWNTTTQDQAFLAGAQRNLFPYTFTFAVGTDIILKDQIVYGGKVLEVVSINTPDSWTTAIRVGADVVA